MPSLTNELINSKDDFIFPVATVFEKPQKELSVKELTSSDLAALKKNDPFMYYSIPSIRKAALHFKKIDVITLTTPASDQTPTKCTDRSSESRITRQSRLSFDCHTDLLLEDFIGSYSSAHPHDIDLENDHFDINEDLFQQLILFETSQ
ncbi:hypothetical protein HJC23_008476 [Cyclotella cryptica]|uniref:Uncharacterized protein n=1 Tax=Cyclotella cryptica TaxID=29204 RepID=A0ABD3QY05_9STRA